MQQREEADAKVWTWLKEELPKQRSNGFTGSTGLDFSDPSILDALWRLVSAGILRPDGSTSQFILTGAGTELTQSDDSPYLASAFLESIVSTAEGLDDDAQGYLRLALDCLPSVPTASVALIRVALEAEVGSLIEQWETVVNKEPDKLLHQWNLGPRIARLVEVIRSSRLLDGEGADEFEAVCTVVRLAGNRVMHVKGGVVVPDAAEVSAVSHAFRRVAQLSSAAKQKCGVP